MTRRRKKTLSKRILGLFKTKKRTGNGTNNSQDLYLMMNFPCVWIWKPGVGESAVNRASEISDEVFGWMIPVIWVNMPYAYPHEQFLLRITKWAYIPFCGKTETRFIFPAILLLPWIIILIAIRHAILLVAFITLVYLVLN